MLRLPFIRLNRLMRFGLALKLRFSTLPSVTYLSPEVALAFRVGFVANQLISLAKVNVQSALISESHNRIFNTLAIAFSANGARTLSGCNEWF